RCLDQEKRQLGRRDAEQQDVGEGHTGVGHLSALRCSWTDLSCARVDETIEERDLLPVSTRSVMRSAGSGLAVFVSFAGRVPVVAAGFSSAIGSLGAAAGGAAANGGAGLGAGWAGAGIYSVRATTTGTGLKDFTRSSGLWCEPSSFPLISTHR